MLDIAHLLDQAERLAAPIDGMGKACSTDLRRSVSAAYYAVFHAGLVAAADLFAGAALNGTPLYSLVYRSIDHSKMKALCQETLKSTPSSKYQRYAPAEGWDHRITRFAAIFIELNERRMLADYDPMSTVIVSEAEASILLARKAIDDLSAAEEASRRTFLALLLFPPR